MALDGSRKTKESGHSDSGVMWILSKTTAAVSTGKDAHFAYGTSKSSSTRAAMVVAAQPGRWCTERKVELKRKKRKKSKLRVEVNREMY